MKKNFILVYVLLFQTNLFAQTDVSGTISDQVWTKEQSPYNVIGNITVKKLEIRPGVIVKFTGNYSFEITGTLTAIGTNDEQIKFSKPYDVTGWQGIYFNFCNNSTVLSHCLIEGSINSGLKFDNSSPTIKNCVIQNNSTIYFGGGIFTNSDLTLEDCEIKSNRTSGRIGGGIYSTGFLKLVNCTISGNDASFTGSDWAVGGGIYAAGSLLMKKCIVEGNKANGSGGGAYKAGYAAGGGIYINSTAELENCIINSNSAGAGANTAAEVAVGGGIFVNSGPTNLKNCILSQNSLYSRELWSGSYAKGGGIYIASGSVTLLNSTVAYNGYEGVIQVGGALIIKNSIIYFNARSQISGGQVNVTYSDVEGSFQGQGNIDKDPIFMDVTSKELHIAPASSCVDKGDPNQAYNDIYFPPSLGTVSNDMGAHGGPYSKVWFGSYIELNLTDCDSIVSPSGKNFWSEDGKYNDAYYDSIYYVEVKILKSYSNFSKISCNNYTSPSGKVWTSSNVYKDTIPNSAGCDSIITIDLSIKNSTLSSIIETACDNYISPSGKIWTTSGVYIDTIPNNFGCDSIITVNLTIDCTSSVRNINSLNYKIYPNPVKNKLYIEFLKPFAKISTIIYSMTGQLLFKSEYAYPNNIEIRFDMPKGFYYLMIQNENNEYELNKIIKN